MRTDSERKLKGKEPDITNDLWVIGVGASAGGLEALKLFFDKLPGSTGAAYIIFQHLDPHHKSLLRDLLKFHTRMEVIEIKNGMKLKPNHVYITPPVKQLTLSGNILATTPEKKTGKPNNPISSFFSSLALAKKERAVGIILSGLGSDGNTGLQAISEAGGFTIVQTPSTAKFPSMPLSAINAGAADLVMPPGKMGQAIAEHIKTLGFISSPSLSVTSESGGDEVLEDILTLVRQRASYDFSNYKKSTILRRVIKRVSVLKMHGLQQYLEFLRKDPKETEHLLNEFFINVSGFFRDRPVFAAIEKKVLPMLLEKTKNGSDLRIWVCGCSHGQEAYSIGILLHEALEGIHTQSKVLIFASDIDKEALQVAREGIYSETIATEISKERLQKYFIKLEKGYQVRKEIRQMMIFAHQNVIQDPPFSRMDLVSCRNLLIYLDQELQRKIIPVFHYSLSKDGILLLGRSENIGDHTDLFSVIDRRNKIFVRKNNHNPMLSEVIRPAAKAGLSTHGGLRLLPKDDGPRPITRIYHSTGDGPCAIINKGDNILYLLGNMQDYLELGKRQTCNSLSGLARKGLKQALLRSLRKARKLRKEVRSQPLRFRKDKQYLELRVEVTPLSKDAGAGIFKVCFVPANAAQKPKATKRRINNQPNMKNELTSLRQHLDAAIEELEISHAELQNTKEEYQSTTEELQSTLEELETSKEELQAGNEELVTINAELQEKIEQVSVINDDLNNLLSSMDVPTVFLDLTLMIKRFTPTAAKIFNIIPSDTGRPVTHLAFNINYHSLRPDVMEVLETLTPKKLEVRAFDGTWFYMRILPYQPLPNNKVEGVLLVFNDISDHKYAEEHLLETNFRLNLINENLGMIPFACSGNSGLKLSFAGKSSSTILGFSPQQLLGSSSIWPHHIHPADRKKIERSLLTALETGSAQEHFRWKFPDGNFKRFLQHLWRIEDISTGARSLIGTWQRAPETPHT